MLENVFFSSGMRIVHFRDSINSQQSYKQFIDYLIKMNNCNSHYGQFVMVEMESHLASCWLNKMLTLAVFITLEENKWCFLISEKSHFHCEKCVIQGWSMTWLQTQQSISVDWTKYLKTQVELHANSTDWDATTTSKSSALCYRLICLKHPYILPQTARKLLKNKYFKIISKTIWL